MTTPATTTTTTGPVPPTGTALPDDFVTLYSLPSSDPYRGNYATPFNAFSVATGTLGWDSLATYNMVLDSATIPMAFVGLFPDANEPLGRTRLVHGPERYPRLMGVTSAYDGNSYAFLDDVAAGTANTIEFPADAFALCHGTTMTVPRSSTLMDGLLASDTSNSFVQLAVGTDTTSLYVPYFMWVPPALISKVIGKNLTPREFYTQVIGPLTTGERAQVLPLIRWSIYAMFRTANTEAASPLLRPNDVSIPFATPPFAVFRQASLHKFLPALKPPGPGPAVATAQIATIMGDLLQAQREANADTADARTQARQPKSVLDFFKPYMTGKLMDITNVAVEIQLPELWHRIAASGGKRERETIEAAFREMGSDMGYQHLVPVVTPDLTKKITALRFAGTNMDDLSDGINPFVMIIPDYTSPSGEKAYLEALSFAQDYDDLVAGTTAADLSDIKALKSAVKVQIPTSFAAVRAMLVAFVVTIAALLGDAHPQTGNLNNFLSEYNGKETFFIGRLQRADGVYGPARLLRFVQLQFRAWFAAYETATTTAARAAIVSPQLMPALHKMQVGDMSWLPDLPASYRMEPKVTASVYEKPDKGTTDADKKKASQVRNMAMNTRFDDFKTGISNNKFNDLIKKVGTPPTVKRGGKEISMCASYHLRGTCFSNCNRKADHGPHTSDEDAALYDWCKLAFE